MLAMRRGGGTREKTHHRTDQQKQLHVHKRPDPTEAAQPKEDNMKKKPTKQEWMKCAMGTDYKALLEAVQKIDPQKLESYLEKDKTDNPYLFNPVKGA
jgi:hypothetical protein